MTKPKASAIHLSYSKGNATNEIAEMKKAFLHNLDLQRYQLGTPYYPGFKEPAKSADVHFEKDSHETKNQAFTQMQLLKMIEKLYKHDMGCKILIESGQMTHYYPYLQ
jgi:hypothetical protein